MLAPAAHGSWFALHHGVRGASGLGAQFATRPRLERPIHRMDHRSGLLALKMAAAVSMDEQPQGRLGNAEDTMRCSSQRPSCTSSPRTPRATRSSLRSTRTSNPRARPPSNNEHAPLRKNEYCRRESTKFHRQALQQRQGAGLNTSKRKRQGARTARQATAVPPPVAPARGARSPRRGSADCERSSLRMINYIKKTINVFTVRYRRVFQIFI